MSAFTKLFGGVDGALCVHTAFVCVHTQGTAAAPTRAEIKKWQCHHLLANQYLSSHCKYTTWKLKGNDILCAEVPVLVSLAGFWVCLSWFWCSWVRWGPEPAGISPCMQKGGVSAKNLRGRVRSLFTLFSKYLSTLAFSLFTDQIPHLQARRRQWSRGAFWATLVFPFRHCLKIHHWRINNYLLYFLHLYLAFVGSICLLGIFVWVLFVSVLGFF